LIYTAGVQYLQGSGMSQSPKGLALPRSDVIYSETPCNWDILYTGYQTLPVVPEIYLFTYK